MQSYFYIPGQEQHALKKMNGSRLTEILHVSASSQKVNAKDSVFLRGRVNAVSVARCVDYTRCGLALLTHRGFRVFITL